MLPCVPFYLVRHGESEANVANLVAGGELDTPLTPKGREQALELAQRLHLMPHPAGKIYHSSLSRARDTALILNDVLQLACEADPDIREHMMGEWSGVRPWGACIADIEAGIIPPGGESYDQLDARILEAFRRLLHKTQADMNLSSESPTIPLIVAHGGVFHALGRLLSIDIPPIHNCTMLFFEPTPQDEQGWRAVFF
ncbi:MAG: histidine phosphatase family protein [Alphaproteobacteria bacterium]|nr:histidine phosphatase family protein [Alphaproteobacteria bacterium]